MDVYFSLSLQPKAGRSVAAIFIAEESPDSKGSCTSEREDIREGMVMEKKKTVRQLTDKGEKVV